MDLFFRGLYGKLCCFFRGLLYRHHISVCVCYVVGLRAGLAASIAGSSIISKMLLANIDPFGATPFIDPDLDSL